VHHQLAALVVLGRGQEQRAREVGAHLLLGLARVQHGVVHVCAVVVGGALVAVEQRVEDPARQRGREKQRVALQRRPHEGAQRAGAGPVLRQLPVVLDLRRLRAGAAAAVDPGRLRP
jgi:hypothetical protein